MLAKILYWTFVPPTDNDDGSEPTKQQQSLADNIYKSISFTSEADAFAAVASVAGLELNSIRTQRWFIRGDEESISFNAVHWIYWILFNLTGAAS